MGGRTSRGWSLMKQSWSVLRLDKELMLLPALSSIACLVVLASFASPLLFVPGLAQRVFLEAKQGPLAPIWQEPVWYVVLLGFYFVNYFVVAFFNTALVSCAIIRFSGGDPTVGDGLHAASQRLPQILAWALLAATVGLILKVIEGRVKLVGRIIVGLIGVGWTVVTYLVVPTLAVERLGPFAAVRRCGGRRNCCAGRGARRWLASSRWVPSDCCSGCRSSCWCQRLSEWGYSPNRSG